MKHLCIYHKNCADGFGAALAVREWFNKNDVPEEDREFVAAQYGDPEEDQPDVKGKFVMIVDFSYPRDVLIQMYADAGRLIVIDHHKTAQEALEGLDFCHFDMSQSGAMLTWKYCFPDSEEHPVPKLIEYIQDRDIWTKALPDTDEVSAALQALPKTFESWAPFLNDCLIDDLAVSGHSILMYQQRHIEKVAHSKLSMAYFCGYHVPCINSTILISEIGNAISKGHPFAMMYFDTEDKRVYSLRSAKGGVDVSEIAKQFGGGGHFHAAGFSVGLDEVLVNNFSHVDEDEDRMTILIGDEVATTKGNSGDGSEFTFISSVAMKLESYRQAMKYSGINIEKEAAEFAAELIKEHYGDTEQMVNAFTRSITVQMNVLRGLFPPEATPAINRVLGVMAQSTNTVDVIHTTESTMQTKH